MPDTVVIFRSNPAPLYIETSIDLPEDSLGEVLRIILDFRDGVRLKEIHALVSPAFNIVIEHSPGIDIAERLKARFRNLIDLRSERDKQRFEIVASKS